MLYSIRLDKYEERNDLLEMSTETTGRCSNLPREGKRFCLFFPVDDRLVNGPKTMETSPVKSIWTNPEGDRFSFETESGTLYTLEVLDIIGGYGPAESQSASISDMEERIGMAI